VCVHRCKLGFTVSYHATVQVLLLAINKPIASFAADVSECYRCSSMWKCISCW